MRQDSPDSRPERYRALASAENYNSKITQPSVVRRFSHWLEARAVERALGDVKGDSVLDCPCGTGRLDGQLRARFNTVVGLDSSEAMLAVYRQGHPERIGQQGDAFALPFADGQFEWVVCHRLLHHFQLDDDRVRLLKSLARVARMGLVVYAWLDTPLNRRRHSRRQTLAPDHLPSLLAAAGVTLEKVHYAAWPFQPKAELLCRKI
ncbi:class I SAM-dependent methyltransferase [Accumulibacter sp.]|uniref:class I SAM-dependent methyltransferase n=1 Tax=Accumulibacter sp. TaxID=2053492 RepID=UPI00261D629E|nr:class I SAM-dependent methyltransferase [Accumulibacter sp.]